jgi:DNA polymerase-3 subunit delta
MVLDFIELFKSLKSGQVERLYLFMGQEELLKREAIDRIKELTVPAGMQDLNFTVIDGSDIAFDSIKSAVETLPFMSRKRMVVVKDINFGTTGRDRISNDDAATLADYMNKVPEYSCVVMTTRGSVDMRTKLAKAISFNGQVVSFDRLKPDMVVKWAAKRFNLRGVKIEPAVLKRFIERTAYLDRDSQKTLDDVDNDIKKLAEYCIGKGRVDAPDIDRVISRSLDLNIFKLVDSLGYRDTGQAVRLLEDMRSAGHPPLKILYMVARQFRLLIRTSYLKDQGYSAKAIASRLGIQPFVAISLIKQTGRFTVGQVSQVLRDVRDTEARIKTGGIDPWLGIELLVVSLGKQ